MNAPYARYGETSLTIIRVVDDPSSLDAAIIRPGRVDAIIELDYATKQQAEDLFNSFYKPREEEQPPYDITKVASYAKTFSSGITEGEFSPASLQSFLLEHRVDPPGALVALPEWVSKQREDKAFHSLSRTIAAMVTDKSKSSVSQPPESAPESDTGSDSEVEDESD